MLKTLFAAAVMLFALTPSDAGQMSQSELDEAIFACKETEPGGDSGGGLAETKAICIAVIEAMAEMLDSKNCKPE